MFKKRLMSFALVMVMGLSLVACNSKDKNTTDATDTTTVADGETTEDTTTAPFNKIDTSNLVWSDYVTLGEYKGIEVEVKSAEVTEDDIQAKVDSLLSYYATLCHSIFKIFPEWIIFQSICIIGNHHDGVFQRFAFGSTGNFGVGKSDNPCTESVCCRLETEARSGTGLEE